MDKLDGELAEEVAIVGRWSLPPLSELGVDEAASRLCDAFTAVCRAAMPPTKRPSPRRALYRWSAEIAGLRAACNGARRQLPGAGGDAPRTWTGTIGCAGSTCRKRRSCGRPYAEPRLELVGGLERDPGAERIIGRGTSSAPSRPQAPSPRCSVMTSPGRR
ncbi:unnamed protein product [Euphydryas editha]|uniref:Uncharacterized protein n=1 Tax=Euphydryas editha TaxID=104508 RepID=A0AAU9TMT9_EUPED|nr:unnamed protein product [Euphydryas editha]